MKYGEDLCLDETVSLHHNSLIQNRQTCQMNRLQVLNSSQIHLNQPAANSIIPSCHWTTKLFTTFWFSCLTSKR